jgi:hypothetical protein
MGRVETLGKQELKKMKQLITPLVIIGGILCVLVGWLLLQPQRIHPQPQIFCDKAHKVPFIDAAHCGGMTSCDRMAFSMGTPVSCPK